MHASRTQRHCRLCRRETWHTIEHRTPDGRAAVLSTCNRCEAMTVQPWSSSICQRSERGRRVTLRPSMGRTSKAPRSPWPGAGKPAPTQDQSGLLPSERTALIPPDGAPSHVEEIRKRVIAELVDAEVRFARRSRLSRRERLLRALRQRASRVTGSTRATERTR